MKTLLVSTDLKGKRKRKRPTDDDLMEADALLAEALQAEEWEGQAPLKLTPRPRRRIYDSDEEVGSEDEEIKMSEGDDFKDLSDFPLARTKRVRVSKSPKSHRRVSRTVNTTSKTAIDEVIDDSDALDLAESSDESIFAPDEILTSVSEDSEAQEVDDEDEDDESVVQPTTSSSSARAQARDAARRRRASQRRSGNATRRRRTWQEAQEERAVRERRRLEKAHPEIKTIWDDLKLVPIITPKVAEQPTEITRKLKSFQLEGLDWMMRQEESQWKGGLLGDEMGMGKTIQAVSLIMSDYPAGSPSLVVVPPVALMQWQNEIKEYTDGKLKVLVYHNTNPKVKNLKLTELKKLDVILISYSGLESIYRKESKGWKRDDGLVKENSKIHAIHYHRLILDEAHNIKSRTTSCAKACFALKADHKWCLSGTPVQNRIGEFFSLLRFLEIRPFACYFCKKCPCAQLHWNQNEEKKCSSCKHTGFEHVSIFNQELLNPITQGEDPSLRQEGLKKLRLVTDRIMLRRMKRDHAASMELPPKEVIIHNEFFGEIERDFSSSIMSNTTRQFDTYVSRGVMLNNYANIFGLIMQMRQVANVSHYLGSLQVTH